jgi:hypothetical protein
VQVLREGNISMRQEKQSMGERSAGLDGRERRDDPESEEKRIVGEEGVTTMNEGKQSPA